MSKNVFIDATAIIIGDVEIGDGVSIWPYAVLRGDEGKVVIGEGSNVQDLAVVHVGTIGRNVTIGHGAVVNNATIGDNCIIGINSTILDHAVVGDECIIGANAVITGNSMIPPRSLVVGVPGRIIKSEDASIKAKALENAEAYHRLRDEHASGHYKRRKGP
jgi:carbonic anhydrase/acetyltransferase-like protein (isoleucine patch superfamily)